jgi:hypothetical protein
MLTSVCSDQYCHGHHLGSCASSYFLDTSDPTPSKGCIDRCHGVGCLVSGSDLVSHRSQSADALSSSACAAAIVKTVYLPSYGRRGDFLCNNRLSC